MALDTQDRDLIETRNRLIVQAGEILTAVAKDGREIRAEEQQEWERLSEAADKANLQLEMRRRQAEREARLEESAGRQTDPNPPGEPESRGTRASGSGHALARQRAGQHDAEEALRAWFIAATPEAGTLTAEQRAAAQRAGVNLESKNLTIRLSRRPPRDLRAVDAWEQRAQTVTTTGGGYLIPDEAMRAIEVALLQFGGVRQAATVIRTDTGADLPIPTSDDTGNKGAIVAINVATTETALTFGQVVLQSFLYSSRLILVPFQLMQDSAINLPEFIGQRLGERIGRITNDHFTTGDASGKPNGIVTASTEGKVGITGQVATFIYNDLVDLEHSVDPAYRGNARWMMPDASLKELKKLVDGDDRPLWQPGLAGLATGAPDTLMGYPYIINQSMDAPAASAKSLLFGDFSKYYIRDVTAIDLLRLDERYAEYHQVAFLAFSRHDGDLVDAGTHPVKHFVHPAA